MTAWWRSIVGVQPAISPTLPCQWSVLPPPVPTCRVQLPSCDLAERRERGGSRVAVHRQHRTEVLADDDAEVADRAEQAALSAGFALFAGRAGEQRGLGHRRCRVHVREAPGCGQQFRLAPAGRPDQERPDRVAVEQVGGDGGEDNQ
jgi:hypothetical protein